MARRGPLPQAFSTRTERGCNTFGPTLAGVKFSPAVMPKALTGQAKRLWREYAPELEAAGVLDRLSQILFEGMLRQYELMETCRRALRKHGTTYTTPLGKIVQRPEVKTLEGAVRSFLAFARDLGVGLPARQRMPAPAERPADDFDSFLHGKAN